MQRIVFILCFISTIATASTNPFTPSRDVTSSNEITISQHHAKGVSITIAAVGDVLLHEPLQRKAFQQGFKSLWSQAIPYIKAADISFANVEGPMAEKINTSGKITPGTSHQVYTSYPLFNYRPSLALALKESGFDIVSTANNHSLDRYNIGVERTIQVLKQAGLLFTGTRLNNDKQPIYTLIERKGIKVAWLACTQDTNGIRDRKNQVLYCYRKIDREKILATIRALRKRVDAIIVSPHWGKQYQHTPSLQQKQLARQLLNAGATAIIGSHPHVLQPIKHYKTKDKRNTLIAYSLGNFVSYQGTPKNRSTVILQLALTKTPKNGTVISNVSVIPAYMQNRSGLNQIALHILSKKDLRKIGYRIIRRVLGI